MGGSAIYKKLLQGSEIIATCIYSGHVRVWNMMVLLSFVKCQRNKGVSHHWHRLIYRVVTTNTTTVYQTMNMGDLQDKTNIHQNITAHVPLM